jgi:uncharacterized protein (DUF1499 family)
MIPAWLSLLDAVLAALLVVCGIAAAHFELIPALFGFQMFILGALLGVLAFFFGLIGLWRTARPAPRIGRYAAWTGVVIGLAIVLPTVALVVRSRAFPLLDDVTTNFAEPPPFMRAGLLEENHNRKLNYDRERWEPVQQAAYGTIAPLLTSDSPALVFAHVRAAAAEMPDWRVTYVDAQQFALEGVMASRLFRFKDDFAIEVQPGSNGGSRIEMRVESRDSINDFGAKARRIRAFFAMLARRPLAAVPAQP